MVAVVLLRRATDTLMWLGAASEERTGLDAWRVLLLHWIVVLDKALSYFSMNNTRITMS